MIQIQFGSECSKVANKDKQVVEFVGKDGTNGGNPDLSLYVLKTELGALAYKNVAEANDLGLTVINNGKILTSLLDINDIKVVGNLITVSEATTIINNNIGTAIGNFALTLGDLAFLDNIGTTELNSTILVGGKILNSLLDIPAIINDGNIATDGDITIINNNINALVNSLGTLAYQDTVGVTNLDTTIISDGLILESLIPSLTGYIYASPVIRQTSDIFLTGNINSEILSAGSIPPDEVAGNLHIRGKSYLDSTDTTGGVIFYGVGGVNSGINIGSAAPLVTMDINSRLLIVDNSTGLIKQTTEGFIFASPIIPQEEYIRLLHDTERYLEYRGNGLYLRLNDETSSGAEIAIGNNGLAYTAATHTFTGTPFFVTLPTVEIEESFDILTRGRVNGELKMIDSSILVVREVDGVLEFKLDEVIVMKLDSDGLKLKSGLEVYPNNF